MTTDSWIINELSAEANFVDARDALAKLEPLLKLRQENRLARSQLLCSKSLCLVQLRDGTPFLAALNRVGKMSPQASMILKWLTSEGYFIRDVMTDCGRVFRFNGRDVTAGGLGECARRQLDRQNVTSFSLRGGNDAFLAPQLEVTYEPPDAATDQLMIENLWNVDELRQRIEQAGSAPTDWSETIAQARERYPHLLIAEAVEEHLERHPHKSAIWERVFSVLEVLNDIVASRDENGQPTDRTKKLLRTHIYESKAVFSDESERNKRDFKDELTFPDPERPERRIFCPYHGKIRSGHFRIHFAWPLKSTDARLKVVHIGPKITKR